MSDDRLPRPTTRQKFRIESAIPANLVQRGLERLHSIAQANEHASDNLLDPILMWTFDDSCHRPELVAALGDRVLVVANDESVQLLDATTGAQLWERADSWGDWTMLPGPDNGNEEVIFLRSDGVFRTLELSTGVDRWCFVGDVVWARIIRSCIIVATQQGTIHALDLEDGRVLWRETFGSRWSSSGGIAAENYFVVLAQGALFIDFESIEDARLVDDHLLRMLDARTGEQQWMKKLAWRDYGPPRF